MAFSMLCTVVMVTILMNTRFCEGLSEFLNPAVPVSCASVLVAICLLYFLLLLVTSSYLLLNYQLGTGGCTQKAEPVRGVYP